MGSPRDGARGVVFAQGGAFGGWSLYLRDDGVLVVDPSLRLEVALARQ